jgi:hypothetical protein
MSGTGHPLLFPCPRACAYAWARGETADGVGDTPRFLSILTTGFAEDSRSEHLVTPRGVVSCGSGLTTIENEEEEEEEEEVRDIGAGTNSLALLVGGPGTREEEEEEEDTGRLLLLSALLFELRIVKRALLDVIPGIRVWGTHTCVILTCSHHPCTHTHTHTHTHFSFKT